MARAEPGGRETGAKYSRLTPQARPAVWWAWGSGCWGGGMGRLEGLRGGSPRSPATFTAPPLARARTPPCRPSFQHGFRRICRVGAPMAPRCFQARSYGATGEIRMKRREGRGIPPSAAHGSGAATRTEMLQRTCNQKLVQLIGREAGSSRRQRAQRSTGARNRRERREGSPGEVL